MHVRRKCCTVSLASSSQLGQRGDVAWRIQCTCLLSAICPDLSCMSVTACLHVNGLTSFIHFLDGMELLIPLIWCIWGEVFQHLCQMQWILAMDSWQIAEMLIGMGLCMDGSRSFLGLHSPIATFLASLSTLLLGSKPLCPGTQWTWMSHTSLVLVWIWRLFRQAWWNVALGNMRWYAKGATKIAKHARALDQSVALWGSESAIRG